jgi:RHS repeat-associated protein
MSVALLEPQTRVPVRIPLDTSRYAYSVLPTHKPITLIDPKDNFEQSYQILQNMIQGNTSPDFEKAVFVSENPFHNNRYTYEQFQKNIDPYLYFIQKLIEANDKSDTMNFDAHVGANGKFKMADIRFLPKEKKERYKKTLTNWAIFKFLTDTVFVQSSLNNSSKIEQYYHTPLEYVTNDPFGKNNWSHSQVIGLLTDNEPKGNCFSMTALYKILANRLHADARLCSAPQHIYIQHRDIKGDYYNVELATAGFPRDGTLQTLTHTTTDAIMSGIALRDYTEQQSIGLCMVNLAKSYEHYFETTDDEFLLRCAETVLKYDSLNLSALLLKQQVLDSRVVKYAEHSNSKNIAKLKQDNNIQQTVIDLEKHTALIYRLGYRQMPLDMQQIIISGNYPDSGFIDKNPSPFTTIDPKDAKTAKYHALYGGLFQEVFNTKPTETYGHVVFDTKTKQLKIINVKAQENELIDPVAFAYDFGARMYDARLGRWHKTDKLEYLYTSLSPYNFAANNPILLSDADGNRIHFNTQESRHKSNADFAAMLTNMFDKQVIISISNNTGYLSIDKVKDISKLSNQQYAMYKYIEKIVNDNFDLELKTTTSDENVMIDAFPDYTVDLGDISITDRRINWTLHFISEQYTAQKENSNFLNTPQYLRSEKFYLQSHIKALNTELVVLGEKVADEFYSNEASLSKMSKSFPKSSELFDNSPRAFILPIVNDCNEVIKYEYQILNPKNGEFKSIIYDKDSKFIQGLIDNPQFSKVSNTTN